jgi:hypothetical protein
LNKKARENAGLFYSSLGGGSFGLCVDNLREKELNLLGPHYAASLSVIALVLARMIHFSVLSDLAREKVTKPGVIALFGS